MKHSALLILLFALLFSSCSLINNHHAEEAAKGFITDIFNSETGIAKGSEEYENVSVVDSKDTTYFVKGTIKYQNYFGAKMKSFFLIRLYKRGDLWVSKGDCSKMWDNEPTNNELAAAVKILEP